MLTAPDVLVVGLRAFAFVAVLQAAGAMIFLGLFGGTLIKSGVLLRKALVVTALMAVALTVLQHLLEPARMTASFAGVWDISLQALLLQSPAGAARAVRLLGLVLVITACLTANRYRDQFGFIGAVVIASSFLLMGHTASHELRWIVSPLLLLHLLVVAFWFGALMPFRLISTREDIATNAAIIQRFSTIATWLVPGILIAGVGITWLLVPAFESLLSSYGVLLLVKLFGFAVLMGLAARNKLSYAPAISRGESVALTRFRQLVKAEWLIIAAVLAVTAVMTSLFSPI